MYLSKEKGLDPMLSTCFLCGKEKNEIILTGIVGDTIRQKAGVHRDARSLCFNKEPCDECKSYMEIGVIFISTKDGENGSDNPYRTGCFSVVKLEAAKRWGLDIDKSRVYFVEDKIWDKMGLPRENINNL